MKHFVLKLLLLATVLLAGLQVWAQSETGTVHVVGKNTVITGKNLWDATNATINFWYSDSNWQQIEDPGFEASDVSYTLTWHTENSYQYQSQMYFTNTGLQLDPNKTYAISLDVTTSKDVKMTIILDNESSHHYTYEDIIVKGKKNVVVSDTFNGIDGDLKLTLDFGGCQAGTVVTISNIVIGEAETTVDTKPIDAETGDILKWDRDGVDWFFLVTDKDKRTCQVGTSTELYADGPAVNTNIKSAIIPSSVGGFTVTAVGNRSFNYISGLQSVTIPNTVVTIGESAFATTLLTTVDIPGSVKEIGEFAFGDCRNLSNVTLNEGLEVIGPGAFENLPEIKSWILPASLKEIKYSAFYSWETTQLESVTVKSSVPAIAGSQAFFQAQGLHNVTLYVPQGAKAAYELAPGWSDFGKIKEEGNPDDQGEHAHGYFKATVDGIEYSCYIVAEGECSIEAPLGNIWDVAPEKRVFAAIDPSTSGVLNIPETINGYTVTALGGYAFFDCNQLTDIIIPNTVKGISSYALGAKNVKSIHIPANVESFSGLSFVGKGEGTGDVGIERVTVDADNRVYDSREDCNAVIESATNRLVAALNTSVIPSSVETIGREAFAYRKGLKEIVIHGNVKEIGYNAFFGCSNLATVIMEDGVEVIGSSAFVNTGISSVRFPKTLTNIGMSAFSGCKNLEAAVLPEGLTIMEHNVFSECENLRSVTLPSTLENSTYWTGLINGEDFGTGGREFANCPNLKTVIARFAEPYPINTSNFTTYHWEYDSDWNVISREEIFTHATLYVPNGTLSKYQNTNGWNKFEQIVEGNPVDITPMVDNVETHFAKDIDENKDLTDVVIDNIYYTVDAGNGDGYDAGEQCVVLNTCMTDQNLAAIEDEKVGSDALRNGYSGIVFEVPAGSGVVSVTAQTLGTAILNVKVGSNTAQTFTMNAKETVNIPYIVESPAYVYIYAGATTNAAPLAKRAAISNNSLKVYGLAWAQNNTGIQNVSNAASSPTEIVTLSGQRIDTSIDALPRGIYIVNGKKITVNK